MQSPHDTPGSHSNQYPQQSSLSSHDVSRYVDRSGQPVGYHPVGQSAQAQAQSPAHGHIQSTNQPTMVVSDPAALPNVPVTQQSMARTSMYPRYPPQHSGSDVHHAASVALNPGIPAHFQSYRPIEHGQPIVPSQPHSHFASPQSPYPNPAMWTQDALTQYMGPTTSSSSPAMSTHPAPGPSTSSSHHVCDVCGATFTRPQNLKRHRESQHTSMEHVCPYCGKSYTRVDSLKRHMDRPCDKKPRSPQEGA